MIPIIQSICAIYVRELTSAKKELDAYEREEDIWAVRPGIANSAGVLARHLAGNLRHFIGHVLGGTSYVRDRDAEFGPKRLSRAELIADLDAAVAEIEATVPGLTDSLLAKEYPLPVANVRLQTGDFLIHLASHAGYHLGQIDFHRRLVTGNGATVGTVAPPRLKSARPVEPAK